MEGMQRDENEWYWDIQSKERYLNPLSACDDIIRQDVKDPGSESNDNTRIVKQWICIVSIFIKRGALRGLLLSKFSKNRFFYAKMFLGIIEILP